MQHYDFVDTLNSNPTRVRDAYTRDGKVVLNSMPAANLHSNYGLGPDYQFITQAEEEAYNESHDYPMDNEAYNARVPHYQYAEALPQ